MAQIKEEVDVILNGHVDSIIYTLLSEDLLWTSGVLITLFHFHFYTDWFSTVAYYGIQSGALK